MNNLLTETVEFLHARGKTAADVRWVGVLERQYFVDQKPEQMPVGAWADFERWANFDYDNGYGVVEVEMDLYIVGDDWWLERAEYDGSEWWEFKTLPRPRADTTPLRASDLKDRD